MPAVKDTSSQQEESKAPSAEQEAEQRFVVAMDAAEVCRQWQSKNHLHLLLALSKKDLPIPMAL